MTRSRVGWRGWATLGAVALLVRVAYVVTFMRTYRPNSDADSYYAIAKAVARGRGYVFTLPFEFTHATAIRPPLTPTVFAAAMRLFGAHVGVAQAVNVVAGSIAVVLGALIAERIAGARAGWCAGLVLALYPPLIANDVTVLVESFAVLLLFACLLLLLDGRTLLAGIALGLTMLDRASAQWLALILGAWVVWRFGWRHALRFLAVAAIVVAPWVVRNWVHVGGPVIVATNGFNLNARYSAEARRDDGFVDGYLDKRFARMRVDATDEIDLDRELRQHALRELRRHPFEIAHVVGSNATQWFELRPSRNTAPERLDGRNLGVRDWTLFVFYPVTIAGLYGLVRFRRNAAVQLIGLTAAYFTAVSLLSIAVPRLRSVFDACIAVSAGVVLAWLIDRTTTVADDPPTVRPIRAATSVLVIGLIVIGTAAGAWAWRGATQRHARVSLTAALQRDLPATGAVAAALRAGDQRDEPPRVERADLDRLHDLVGILGDRTPEATPAVRARAAVALRALRVATHEVDIIDLLSAAEYLGIDRPPGPPSRDRVEQRYETKVRPDDPAIDPWTVAANGTTMRDAATALDALSRALRN